MRVWLAGLLLLPTIAFAQPVAGPFNGTTLAFRNQEHWIPQSEGGQSALLYTHICRPSGDAPARLVVISHGRAANASERATQEPASCGNEAVEWFTRRGFVVIAPLRVGYGQTGGPDAEADRCTPRRDYSVGAHVAARAIGAAIAYAATLPFVRKDGIVLVGQSAGGLATLEFASHAPPNVAAVVNMAGGNGGHMQNQRNNNCYPELLAQATGRLGATSRIPEIWFYAANDSFFAPEIAVAMHDAFVKAGGQAELIQPGPFGSDGHGLFFGRRGSQVWGAPVERYLQMRGVL